ncbi:MAG: YceI family protein, partial [Candidatus Dormibacteraeota bacterium]|nr:YceI family protein [Candidatus Dormibacteraeota bacterium]
IRTRRQGAAARAGHDLVIEATRWTATVRVDAAGPAGSSLAAIIDAASLVVREASGGALPITEGQKDEIAKTTRTKVLHADKNPEIKATSTAVTATGDGAEITLDLVIAGKSRPATLVVHVAEDGDGVTVTGSTTVCQTDFGITPYSALFGTLKVRDEVEITVEVRLPAS